VLAVIRQRFITEDIFNNEEAVVIPDVFNNEEEVVIPVSQLDDTDDPMNCMEAMSGQTAEALKAKKVKKERMRRMCNHKELVKKGSVIKELQMPTIPKCAEVSQSRLGEMGGQTTIYVYKKYDATKSDRINAANALFLRSDGLEWLIKYASLEYDHQGIEEYDPCATQVDPKQANVPEVAGLRLEWGFTESAWTANFVSRSEAGDRRTMKADDINTLAWSFLRARDFVTGFRCHSSPQSRRNATKELLILWARAVLDGKGDDFDSLLEPYQNRQNSKPNRKSKQMPAEGADHSAGDEPSKADDEPSVADDEPSVAEDDSEDEDEESN